MGKKTVKWVEFKRVGRKEGTVGTAFDIVIALEIENGYLVTFDFMLQQNLGMLFLYFLNGYEPTLNNYSKILSFQLSCTFLIKNKGKTEVLYRT